MTKVVQEWKEWVRMNNKNEKHFSMRLNIPMCGLLQVLAEAAIKKCFGKELFVEF